MQRRRGILDTDTLEALLELVVLEWNHMLQKIFQAKQGCVIEALRKYICIHWVL
jgi:hypothetical protein